MMKERKMDNTVDTIGQEDAAATQTAMTTPSPTPAPAQEPVDLSDKIGNFFKVRADGDDVVANVGQDVTIRLNGAVGRAVQQIGDKLALEFSGMVNGIKLEAAQIFHVHPDNLTTHNAGR